ncbi:unnamed protein product, partial [Ceratitis capitata]
MHLAVTAAMQLTGAMLSARCVKSNCDYKWSCILRELWRRCAVMVGFNCHNGALGGDES